MTFALTIRLIYHGFHGLWSGFLIATVGWTAQVGASASERAALGTPAQIERPHGLVEMRIARITVHIAPNRAAQMLSDASNLELSPANASMFLREIAKGPVASRAAFA